MVIIELPILMYIKMHVGFKANDTNFGVIKKKKYIPCSDFGIKFIAEVISVNPHSSGFLVEVTPDRTGDLERQDRYVTIESWL